MTPIKSSQRPMHKAQPLVSILTPVFNEEKYLAECVDSVLAQTYQNWDYTIVDNCSTDRSLEIAQAYAKKDSRIRVVKNESFVSAIENHNIAFRQLSSESAYCKLLSGDDWLYPEFISKSVEIAERYPNVGIVASYSINTEFGFRWPRLSPHENVFPGHDICRLFLMGLIDSFFAPSVVLYRSSLVRAQHAFYPGSAPSADLGACLNSLAQTDLGFVHQVLSFERIHEASYTAKVRGMHSYLLDRICILNEFGPQYLQPSEHEEHLNAMLTEYYENVLVAGIFTFREPEFWRFHKARLKEMGYPFYCGRLGRGIAKKCADLVFNPKTTVEKLVKRFQAREKQRGDDIAVHPISTASRT